MKILVFGATGPTGREIVRQGLDFGYEITAFARNPQKITTHHQMLSVIVGDASDEKSVANAVAGHDIILSALGTGRLPIGNIFSLGVKNIINGMQLQNVKRLIVLSSCGVGESFKELPLPLQIGVKTLLKSVFADKEQGEKYLKQSNLDWTCVCPVILTNGPKLGQSAYRTGQHIPLGRFPRISRADVADFMLKIVEDDSTFQKNIVISQ